MARLKEKIAYVIWKKLREGMTYNKLRKFNSKR